MVLGGSMANAPLRFTDVQGHWAQPFIEALAQRRVINGFPDGKYHPNQPVTRAQFAVVLDVAFPFPPKRPYIPFADAETHWAVAAIQRTFERGFLSGYPDRTFRPNATMSRIEMLIALVGGLGLKASGTISLPSLFQDLAEVPAWAMPAIAAAAEGEIIVSYPHIRQLRSQQPATRADVAVSVYQGLVRLGQAGAITSAYIVRPNQPQLVTVSHTREFRAAWLTSVWNKDFPSNRQLTSQQQQAELLSLLDQIQALNFNAVVLQVRPEGDALYASQLEPWSYWLTGHQGKAPNPFYDPLEFAIRECHKRNLELHAWFNPYRARTTASIVNVRPHMAVTNPEVVYEWGNQLWMDPGAKVVEDRTYAVIMDVVRRYDVDGIHLDDYFYPYPIAGKTFPDDKTYQAYQAGGGRLARADWRRENVNRLVQRLAQGIRTTKPHVKFGISPFGIYRPGQPPQIQGLDAYEALYADALKWLQQGWLDYCAPQLYWRIDPPAQSYPVLLQWWVDSNTRQRHIYVGNNIAQLDGRAWELSEITRQIDLTRRLNGQLALGNIFFSMNVLRDNRQNIRTTFQQDTYRQPALPPAMNWLTASAPPLPQVVSGPNRMLTWQADANARSWTLYHREANNTWRLLQILPGGINRLAVEPGTYALCSVNRLAQESAGVVVNVG